MIPLSNYFSQLCLSKPKFLEYERRVPSFQKCPVQIRVCFNNAAKYQFIVFGTETLQVFFLMLACDGWYTAKGKEHSAYCAMYIILRTSTIIKTFNFAPSTNYKHSAVSDHARASGHMATTIFELKKRNSSLSQQHKEAHEVTDMITYNAFLSSDWFTKEDVANKKLRSLTCTSSLVSLSGRS